MAFQTLLHVSPSLDNLARESSATENNSSGFRSLCRTAQDTPFFSDTLSRGLPGITQMDKQLARSRAWEVACSEPNAMRVGCEMFCVRMPRIGNFRTCGHNMSCMRDQKPFP